MSAGIILYNISLFLTVVRSCNICHSIGVQRIPIHCTCDNVTCTLDKNCCPLVTDGYLDYTPKKEFPQDLSEFMKCQSILQVNSEPVHVGDAYYMVSVCPDDSSAMDVQYHEEISSNCTKFTEFPPVSDLSTGLTFKNIFCAVCHGVNISSLLTWQTNVVCTFDQQGNITSMNLLKSMCTRCSFQLPKALTDNDLQWCIPVISHCRNSTKQSQMIDVLCNDGPFRPVYEKSCSTFIRLYKNFFCALCNEVTDEYSIECSYPQPSHDSLVTQCLLPGIARHINGQ